MRGRCEMIRRGGKARNGGENEISRKKLEDGDFAGSLNSWSVREYYLFDRIRGSIDGGRCVEVSKYPLNRVYE